MKKDQFKFTCLASKIALLVVLTSAPVQGATWSSTSSIYPYARVYVGVGYYYDPAVYLRVGQQIGFDATGIVYLLAQVKYGTGTWQMVSNGSAGGLILVTPPLAIRGTYTMEFKLIDELGNTYYHTYTVYVVPSAHLGYIDTIGNRMVMWDDGDGILDNPFILIEGFDPTNENNVNLYFQKSNGLFDQVLSLGRDILVFDFANGGIDMVVNAQYITDAVNYINGVKMGSSGIILAGVSMGGVVCRYALAKEEQDGTPLNVSHFVSIDSPQQDAVIDKTLQDYMKSKGISPASLSSLAAKQLLRENVFSTGNEHQNFYNALNVLNGDGYPHLPVNIAIPFSPNVANTNSGLWLEVRNSLGIGEQTFNIITGSPIKEAGSYLPLESTEQWGVVFNFPISYELIRYSNPTFIPHKSALDLDTQGISRFDHTISSDSHHFHNEVPYDIIDPLLISLGLKNPLSAVINGPSTRTIGQSGTWTASASGGTTPYTYRWDYQLICPGSGEAQPKIKPLLEDCNVWYFGGNTSSMTKSINGNFTLLIKLTTTDKVTNSIITQKSVIIGTGSNTAKQTTSNAILESPPYIFLEQNYPNPFNAVMEIRYHTKEPALVTLCVYDLMGRPMIVLVDEFMQSGYHRIMFDAKDLPSGIYLYRLAAGMQSQTRTLVFIK
jgi:hypothetical protein